jgi:protein NrfC
LPETNLAAGKEPACVESCPTKALVKETTYRYKQALGTSPKMYRVPKGEIKS